MTDDAQLDPPIGPDGRSLTGDESSFETDDALHPDPEVRFGGPEGPNAGYTGGLATGTQDAEGMRQIVTDEGEAARHEAAEEGRRGPQPPANLAQEDQ